MESVQGEAGNFTARVHTDPRYINEDLCTACGICTMYCPVITSDIFNEGLALTKNLHKDYPQAVPSSFYIDPKECLFVNHEMCRICASTCQAQAIDFNQTEEEHDLSVGSVILTPGFGRIDDEVLSRYGFGKYPDVLTSIEFERLTCASGPTEGTIVRPSDQRHPKHIAFLQCIGSRDETCGNGYCSSVCCMYAIKEASVAKEHDPDLDITIFYMDMRTQGKEFDASRQRAREKYGIKFVRSRIAGIQEQGDQLRISYVDGRGAHHGESFDMVVLSEGLESPEGADDLARSCGIDINKYEFCSTQAFTPLQTSRQGIFVAGAFGGPKDIPESVTEATGAVASVDSLLNKVRGSQVEKKEYPAELVIGDEPRIGVFVCHCGSNIAGVIDVAAVREYASTLDGVVYADQSLYSCAQDAQQILKEKIKEHNLNRVIVSACTPRTHEPLFQETLRDTGLNRALFEMVNIRDQCSWVHAGEPEEATEKAKDLVRMAVAKAGLAQPLPEQQIPVIPKALVIGGGISGMTAALSMAEQGFETFLVEKSDKLGGNLRNVSALLSGEDPRKIVKEVEKKIASNDLIRVYTGAEVESVSGYVGNFTTNISSALGTQVIEHGVIIIATGGRPYEPKQYCYETSKQVITQIELEDAISSGALEKDLQQVVMIQCVGSRGDDLSYCSKVCCGQAVKNALRILDKYPNADIYILYRDIRTYGFMEDYYKKAREKGVVFVNYDKEKAPVATDTDGRLSVTFFDEMLDDDITLEPDLLVLSVGIVPNDVDSLSKILKVPVTKDNFFLEAHVKLRPVEFAVDGVFMCGLAHSPKPVNESIAQAKSAAGKAALPLAKGVVSVEPIVSKVNPEICIGCGICVSLCPYQAIQMVKAGKKKKAETISASCKGCGICASHCPTLAISMGGFTNEQIRSQIKAFGG